MPKNGWYFDAIVRQTPIDDDTLTVEDNLEEFQPIREDELEHFKTETDRLCAETERAIFASFAGTAFGDIALVPAPWLKRPKGIRDLSEWYMSTVSRRDFVLQGLRAAV